MGPEVAAIVAAAGPEVVGLEAVGVEVVELDGDPARVVEAWDGAATVVVVDAVRSGSRPGSIHRRVVGRDPLPAPGRVASSHGLGVADAVALGRALDRLPARLVVIGVEAGDLGDGPGLSAAVAAAVPAAAAIAVDELAGGGAEPSWCVRIDGTVQGVGFRPFVARTATRLGVRGEVRNVGGGVELRALAPRAVVDHLADVVAAQAPPGAEVVSVVVTPAAPGAGAPVAEGGGDDGFRIVASAEAVGGVRRVAVDRAPCPDCAAEQDDPADRRYRYAFGSCTTCGPRSTIVSSLPYDRARTALAGFPLCLDCAAERDDPADRRYGAEALACPACGPTAALLDAEGAPVAGDPVAGAAARIAAGAIVAVKGVGGWQLACDARDAAAVAELRRRVRRPDKPLAVMVADVAAAHRWFAPTAADEALLASPAAPIVLVDDRGRLPATVAPGHHRHGVLLPASLLHRLLALEVDAPVVLTSGNRAGEPIPIDDAVALARLAGVADAFLTHDRPIVARSDDSVVMATPVPAVLRRARGCAPAPLRLARSAVPLLAVGPDLHHTFCLAADTDAVLSPHVGDLDDADTIAAWHAALDHLLELTGVTPTLVAHDRHPDMVSTRLAEDLAAVWGVPRQPVGHHHAHVAAVAAEHGLTGPVLGVALDGFGLGDDGTAWGGELLLVDGARCTRVGHLDPVPLAGGDLAARHPARMALVHAARAGVLDGACALLGLVDDEPAELLGGVSPGALVGTAAAMGGVTSSAGRLLDAVAALAGVGHSPTYEGQPAVLWEQAALRGRDDAVAVAELALRAEGDRLRLDPAPLVASVVAALTGGAAPADVAAGVHAALARSIIVAVEDRSRVTGVRDVALAGGVWANGLLAAAVSAGLRDRGLEVHRAAQVPSGDGGLALGQAWVAAARAATGAVG